MNFTYSKSLHEQALDQLFKNVVCERDPDNGPLDCVIMAFVNRSGSNYLSQLLTSSGRFTGFDEALNHNVMKAMVPRYGVDSLSGYLRRLRRENVKIEGQVWGIKVGWMQLAMLLRADAIPNVLRPTVLNVRRKDTVGQAISFYIAEQTNQWLHNDKAKTARTDVKYDGDAILSHFRSIMQSYCMLDQIIALAKLPSHEVNYEEFVDNPTSTVSDVSFWLTGQRTSIRHSRLTLEIQRDEVSENFRTLFMKDLCTIQWSAI